MNKADKQKIKLRLWFTAELFAQGHSCNLIMTRLTEEFELSRRKARGIKAKPKQMIIQDF